MALKRKKKCPFPGCGWKGKILYGANGHVTLRHPGFEPGLKPNIPTATVTPAEDPKIPGDIPIQKPNDSNKAALSEEKKARNFSAGKIMLILGGLVLIAISFFTGREWMANYSQSFLGIATALSFGIGAFLIFWAFKRKAGSYNRPSLRAGIKKYKGNANSIIVYAKPDPADKDKLKPWKIEFDHLNNPPGLRRKLRNDGNYYSFNICKQQSYTVDAAGNVSGLEDMALNDTAYCDPRLLKDAVEMRYSREYYTPDPNLLQKIKPFLFIIIVVVGALILIMVGNPTPA